MAQVTSTTKTSPWIYGASLDFSFIFLLVLLGGLFLPFQLSEVTADYAVWVALISMILSLGHNYSPILYYLTTPEERKRIKTLNPHANKQLLFVFLFPTLLLLGSAYYYSQGDERTKLLFFSIRNKSLFFPVFLPGGSTAFLFNRTEVR